MERPLLCPQCGVPLFFVKDEAGVALYFRVTRAREIVPTRPEFDRVRSMALEEIRCTGCSWKGSVLRLRERV